MGMMDSDFEQELKRILEVDDKHKFVLFIRSQMKSSRQYMPTILKHICLLNSVDCATALLEGETGRLKVDLNCPVLGDYFPLHLAARNLFPLLSQLFIRHGAGIMEDCFVLDEHKGYPLMMALEAARNDKRLNSWTPGRSSVFKLIIILCLPEMKNALDTNKFLLPDLVFPLALTYIEGGGLIELAILLMVAREKVLCPIRSLSNLYDAKYILHWFFEENKFCLDGSLTISQWINYKIISLMDNEIYFMGNRKLTQLHMTKMMVMRSARLLLEVFERAGDKIVEYMQLQQSNVEKEKVAKDVSFIFSEAGFDLKPSDSDLIDIYWLGEPKIAPEQSECGTKRTLPLSPLQQTKVSLPNLQYCMPKSVEAFSTFSPSGTQSLCFGKHSIHTNRALKSIFGYRCSKIVDVQLKKRIGGIEQCGLKFLSVEKLAYFALTIKWGIRRA